MSEEKLFKNRYRIRSIRLPDWDYKSDGAYFITICVKNRECVFGKIVNGKMVLSEIGEIVQRYWYEIPDHFDNVQLDEFVVMPNHFHGIVIICDSRRRDVACNVSTMACNVSTGNIMSRISPRSNSLSAIIRSFKSAVSNWCHKNGFEFFQWQSRFYERIIRNEKELNFVREYIANNPLKWDVDRNNRGNINHKFLKND